jgi:hypothetical protein
MTIEQLALAVGPTASPAHRCRMCARPARWSPVRAQWSMYCAGSCCDNRERLCQRCGGPFAVKIEGAGTKYCAECQPPAALTAAGSVVRCAWCEAFSPQPGKWAGRVWPYICATCIDPIKHVAARLKAHRVPHERARRLLDDPGCEVCGANLLARFREAGHGRLKALLVVDHDHTCCPVDKHSCGQCVRGLLCRHCNSAAGLLKDNPESAQRLARYLLQRPAREAS